MTVVTWLIISIECFAKIALSTKIERLEDSPARIRGSAIFSKDDTLGDGEDIDQSV